MNEIAHGECMLSKQFEKIFEVRRCGNEHKCYRPLRNMLANSEWIDREYLKKLRVNSDYKVKDMISNMNEKYANIVAKEVCHRAKRKALRLLRGFIEKHYSRLRSYVAEL